jgi:hypothetical protein
VQEAVALAREVLHREQPASEQSREREVAAAVSEAARADKVLLRLLSLEARDEAAPAPTPTRAAASAAAAASRSPTSPPPLPPRPPNSPSPADTQRSSASPPGGGPASPASPPSHSGATSPLVVSLQRGALDWTIATQMVILQASLAAEHQAARARRLVAQCRHLLGLHAQPTPSSSLAAASEVASPASPDEVKESPGLARRRAFAAHLTPVHTPGSTPRAIPELAAAGSVGASAASPPQPSRAAAAHRPLVLAAGGVRISLEFARGERDSEHPESRGPRPQSAVLSLVATSLRKELSAPASPWEFGQGSFHVNAVPLVTWNTLALTATPNEAAGERDLIFSFDRTEWHLPHNFFFGDAIEQALLHWRAYKIWRRQQEETQHVIAGGGGARARSHSHHGAPPSAPRRPASAVEGADFGDLVIEARHFKFIVDDSDLEVALRAKRWLALTPEEREEEARVRSIYSYTWLPPLSSQVSSLGLANLASVVAPPSVSPSASTLSVGSVEHAEAARAARLNRRGPIARGPPEAHRCRSIFLLGTANSLHRLPSFSLHAPPTEAQPSMAASEAAAAAGPGAGAAAGAGGGDGGDPMLSRLREALKRMRAAGLIEANSIRFALRVEPGMLEPARILPRMARMDSCPAPPYASQGVSAFSDLWLRTFELTSDRFCLWLRDYPMPLLSTRRLRLQGPWIMAQMRCPPVFRELAAVRLPHSGAPTVAVERVSEVPLKVFYELAGTMDQATMSYGLGIQPGLSALSEALSRLSDSAVPDYEPPADHCAPPFLLRPSGRVRKGGRLAWWDNMRYRFHGRVELRVENPTVRSMATGNPYSTACVEAQAPTLTLGQSNGEMWLNSEDVSLSIVDLPRGASPAAHMRRGRGQGLLSPAPPLVLRQRSMDGMVVEAEGDTTQRPEELFDRFFLPVSDEEYARLPRCNGTLAQVPYFRLHCALSWRCEGDTHPYAHYVHFSDEVTRAVVASLQARQSLDGVDATSRLAHGSSPPTMLSQPPLPRALTASSGASQSPGPSSPLDIVLTQDSGRPVALRSGTMPPGLATAGARAAAAATAEPAPAPAADSASSTGGAESAAAALPKSSSSPLAGAGVGAGTGAPVVEARAVTLDVDVFEHYRCRELGVTMTLLFAPEAYAEAAAASATGARSGEDDGSGRESVSVGARDEHSASARKRADRRGSASGTAEEGRRSGGARRKGRDSGERAAISPSDSQHGGDLHKVTEAAAGALLAAAAVGRGSEQEATEPPEHKRRRSVVGRGAHAKNAGKSQVWLTVRHDAIAWFAKFLDFWTDAPDMFLDDEPKLKHQLKRFDPTFHCSPDAPLGFGQVLRWWRYRFSAFQPVIELVHWAPKEHVMGVRVAARTLTIDCDTACHDLAKQEVEEAEEDVGGGGSSSRRSSFDGVPSADASPRSARSQRAVPSHPASPRGAGGAARGSGGAWAEVSVGVHDDSDAVLSSTGEAAAIHPQAEPHEPDALAGVVVAQRGDVFAFPLRVAPPHQWKVESANAVLVKLHGKILVADPQAEAELASPRRLSRASRADWMPRDQLNRDQPLYSAGRESPSNVGPMTEADLGLFAGRDMDSGRLASSGLSGGDSAVVLGSSGAANEEGGDGAESTWVINFMDSEGCYWSPFVEAVRGRRVDFLLNATFARLFSTSQVVEGGPPASGDAVSAPMPLQLPSQRAPTATKLPPRQPPSPTSANSQPAADDPSRSPAVGGEPEPPFSMRAHPASDAEPSELLGEEAEIALQRMASVAVPRGYMDLADDLLDALEAGREDGSPGSGSLSPVPRSAREHGSGLPLSRNSTSSLSLMRGTSQEGRRSNESARRVSASDLLLGAELRGREGPLEAPASPMGQLSMSKLDSRRSGPSSRLFGRGRLGQWERERFQGLPSTLPLTAFAGEAEAVAATGGGGGSAAAEEPASSRTSFSSLHNGGRRPSQSRVHSMSQAPPLQQPAGEANVARDLGAYRFLLLSLRLEWTEAARAAYSQWSRVFASGASKEAVASPKQSARLIRTDSQSNLAVPTRSSVPGLVSPSRGVSVSSDAPPPSSSVASGGAAAATAAATAAAAAAAAGSLRSESDASLNSDGGDSQRVGPRSQVTAAAAVAAAAAVRRASFAVPLHPTPSTLADTFGIRSDAVDDDQKAQGEPQQQRSPRQEPPTPQSRAQARGGSENEPSPPRVTPPLRPLPQPQVPSQQQQHHHHDQPSAAAPPPPPSPALRRAPPAKEANGLVPSVRLYTFDIIRPQLGFRSEETNGRLVLAAKRASMHVDGYPFLFDWELLLAMKQQQEQQQQPQGARTEAGARAHGHGHSHGHAHAHAPHARGSSGQSRRKSTGTLAGGRTEESEGTRGAAGWEARRQSADVLGVGSSAAAAAAAALASGGAVAEPRALRVDHFFKREVTVTIEDASLWAAPIDVDASATLQWVKPGDDKTVDARERKIREQESQRKDGTPAGVLRRQSTMERLMLGVGVGGGSSGERKEKDPDADSDADEPGATWGGGGGMSRILLRRIVRPHRLLFAYVFDTDVESHLREMARRVAERMPAPPPPVEPSEVTLLQPQGLSVPLAPPQSASREASERKREGEQLFRIPTEADAGGIGSGGASGAPSEVGAMMRSPSSLRQQHSETVRSRAELLEGLYRRLLRQLPDAADGQRGDVRAQRRLSASAAPPLAATWVPAEVGPAFTVRVGATGYAVLSLGGELLAASSNLADEMASEDLRLLELRRGLSVLPGAPDWLLLDKEQSGKRSMTTATQMYLPRLHAAMTGREMRTLRNVLQSLFLSKQAQQEEAPVEAALKADIPQDAEAFAALVRETLAQLKKIDPAAAADDTDMDVVHSVDIFVGETVWGMREDASEVLEAMEASLRKLWYRRSVFVNESSEDLFTVEELNLISRRETGFRADPDSESSQLGAGSDDKAGASSTTTASAPQEKVDKPSAWARLGFKKNQQSPPSAATAPVAAGANPPTPRSVSGLSDDGGSAQRKQRNVSVSSDTAAAAAAPLRPAVPAQNWILRPDPTEWNDRHSVNDVMLRLRATRTTPLHLINPHPHLAWVVVYDHVELTTFPLMIQLPHDHYQLVRDYFFPEDEPEATAAKVQPKALWMGRRELERSERRERTADRVDARAIVGASAPPAALQAQGGTASPARSPVVSPRTLAAAAAAAGSASPLSLGAEAETAVERPHLVSSTLQRPPGANPAESQPPMLSLSLDEGTDGEGTALVPLASSSSATAVAAASKKKDKKDSKVPRTYFLYVRMGDLRVNLSYKGGYVDIDRVPLRIPALSLNHEFGGWSGLLKKVEKHVGGTVYSHCATIISRKLLRSKTEKKSRRDSFSAASKQGVAGPGKWTVGGDGEAVLARDESVAPRELAAKAALTNKESLQQQSAQTSMLLGKHEMAELKAKGRMLLGGHFGAEVEASAPPPVPQPVELGEIARRSPKSVPARPPPPAPPVPQPQPQQQSPSAAAAAKPPSPPARPPRPKTSESEVEMDPEMAALLEAEED